MKQILLFLVLCSGTLNAQLFTTPPQGPVRTMAEWEELQTLIISWKAYNPILTEIVRAAREECKVVICCDNQSVVDAAKNILDDANIDTTSNVEFVIMGTNSIWIRDYGPNAVYANDVDSLMLVDWIYNRNRPLDNSQSERYGQHTGLPVYATSAAPYDLVNTGGNFMADGLGTAFASKLIFRNNDQIQNGEGSPNDVFGVTDHTESSIDQIMAEFMGIDRYIKMDELPFDGIHHIDMHMKLLDEETLLVGEYPENVSDGPQLEANLLYVLNNFKTSFGTDYKVVRIPMPPYNNNYPPFPSPNENRYPTYANAVFVNKTVIMPKYNLTTLDAAARDTFEKYLPGYEVVQVNCNSMITAGGAIHCITKEVGVNDPLRIVHPVIRYADNAESESYRVRALVQHRSGITGASLFWTTDLSAPWNEIVLSPDTTPQYWTALIPQQDEGATVYYYLQATAANGKTAVRPMPAPEGYWSFKVLNTTGVNPATIADWKPLFPNPARAISTIPVHFSAKTSGTVYVTNALGQVMETIWQGAFTPGDTHFFIHADRYAPGMYQVVLQTPHQQLTQTLIVE
jgi:agmatine deiminase